MNKPKTANGNLMKVNLSIDGLRKGTVYICTEENQQYKVWDSIVFEGINSEEKHFELPMHEPDMVYLFMKRDFTNTYNNNLRFFGEPSEITIKTSNDNFYNATIKGSESEEVLQNYMDMIAPFNKAYNEAVGVRIIAENKNDTKTVENYTRKLAEIKYKKAIKTMHFTWQHPDQKASAYIAYLYMDEFLPKFADTIYKRLAPEVQQSKYGTLIYNQYIKEKNKN